MNKAITRTILALALIALAATSALGAYDYTIKGGFYPGWTPDWWDNGWMRLRAEWNADPGWLVDEWRPNYGVPPNHYEVHNMDPLNLQIGYDDPNWWAWSNNGIFADYVDEDGILLKGGLRQQDVDLQLGNQYLPTHHKYWYVELELSHVPANWWGVPAAPRNRLSRVTTYSQMEELGGWLPRSDPASGITLLGRGWVAYDAAGNWLGDPYANPAIRSLADTLVWWQYALIEPQPWAEKILWEFDNGPINLSTDDYRIVRVVTGTYCTPEPVSAALLALGLPVGWFLRRRCSRRAD